MEFIVEGEPQGKARPRFSRRSGTVYTPSKTAKYEKQIRKAFLAVGGKMIPSDCYVNRPAKKPDVDNILKAVLDALNGMAYKDDKQVIEVTCGKWYSQSSGFLKISVEEVKV